MRMLMLALLALLVFMAGLSVAAPVPPDKKPEADIKDLLDSAKRLPLRAESSREAREVALPLATVGSFSEEEYARLPQNRTIGKARAAVQGLVKLQPPRAGTPTDALLVGPVLNSGESWLPAPLGRRASF